MIGSELFFADHSGACTVAIKATDVNNDVVLTYPAFGTI